MGAKYTAGKNAVGPNKRPPTNDQLAGRLAGVPVLPHDATLVNVALLKSVPVRFVPANVVLARFAPIKFVLVRFAPAKFAPVMTALCKSNVLRFAPVRLAVGPIRYPFFTCQFVGKDAVPITPRADTLVSIAVVKSTLLISTRYNTAFVKIALCRLPPTNDALVSRMAVRLAPVRLAVGPIR